MKCLTGEIKNNPCERVLVQLLYSAERLISERVNYTVFWEVRYKVGMRLDARLRWLVEEKIKLF